MSLSIDCKEMGDVANKIWSSAYSIRNNLSPSIENRPVMSVLRSLQYRLQTSRKVETNTSLPVILLNVNVCCLTTYCMRMTERTTFIAFVILALIFSAREIYD